MINVKAVDNFKGHQGFSFAFAISDSARHPAFVASTFNSEDGYFFQQIKRLIPVEHHEQLDTISSAIVLVNDKDVCRFDFNIIDTNEEEAIRVADVLVDICKKVHQTPEQQEVVIFWHKTPVQAS